MRKLRERISRTDSADEKKRLTKQLALFEGVRVFDSPRRDYYGLVFTATRRFSKAFFGQASYTFSQNKGNYPGLVSYANGQLDPNISSQYDLVELLANRNGFLDMDTPHNLRVDGAYTLDLEKAGKLTLGLSASLLSGTPYGALGGHYTYGQNESFLLPRGSVGRTAMNHRINARLIYGRKLSNRTEMEVFFDAFNLYNQQNFSGIDDTYAVDTGDNAANPIVGGQYQDLIWAKAVLRSGAETGNPLIRNPNFGNGIGRYSPVQGRFGFRLTF